MLSMETTHCPPLDSVNQDPRSPPCLSLQEDTCAPADLERHHDTMSPTPKFRPYPYGSPFKVGRDHHALCWPATLKDHSGCLARWSLRLQEYDITVIYKSGKKHSDADCLSRAPVDQPPPDDPDHDYFLGTITTDDFAERQRADPELKALIEYLEGRSTEVSKVFKRALASFFLRNGLL
ncbi:uncharacterized protein LOC142769125 isoform X2 [Rhipicephalus microplus]|uniref:uncharacterized protein LOC142769125 isoform X2 n=1 Tax=Rhipicephalus microplus TaxID=6941 RepID=UPI003F6C994E